MDLSSAITIERPGQSALDINSIRDPQLVGSAPLSGYSVEEFDMSAVSVNAFTEDTPQLDGSDSYDPYLSSRTINMVVSIYGSSYGDFWDKLDALNYALQAQPKYASGSPFPEDGRRKLSFSQASASGSKSLYMLVRPLALPRFVVGKEWSAGDPSKGWAASVRVSLTAEDPYKYFSSNRTFTRSGTGTITVINDGTVAAWPTVTWENTSSSISSVTLGSYTVSHSANSETITDVFRDSTSSNYNSMTGYSFFSIPPGTSTLSVVGSGTITVTISEAIL